jgi:hypothetical protein
LRTPRHRGQHWQSRHGMAARGGKLRCTRRPVCQQFPVTSVVSGAGEVCIPRKRRPKALRPCRSLGRFLPRLRGYGGYDGPRLFGPFWGQRALVCLADRSVWGPLWTAPGKAPAGLHRARAAASAPSEARRSCAWPCAASATGPVALSSPYTVAPSALHGLSSRARCTPTACAYNTPSTPSAVPAPSGASVPPPAFSARCSARWQSSPASDRSPPVGPQASFARRGRCTTPYDRAVVLAGCAPTPRQPCPVPAPRPSKVPGVLIASDTPGADKLAPPATGRSPRPPALRAPPPLGTRRDEPPVDTPTHHAAVGRAVVQCTAHGRTGHRPP